MRSFAHDFREPVGAASPRSVTPIRSIPALTAAGAAAADRYCGRFPLRYGEENPYQLNNCADPAVCGVEVRSAGASPGLDSEKTEKRSRYTIDTSRFQGEEAFMTVLSILLETGDHCAC